jgi:hypothetical protein
MPKDKHHPQRISQQFMTLLKVIVGLLWLKFIRILVRISAMEACSPSLKRAAVLKNFGPMGTPDPKLHFVALTQGKLAQMYWTALEHPPYSLDLSPCDHHMFGTLKGALRGSISTMMRRSRILCASGYRCVLLHSMT